MKKERILRNLKPSEMTKDELERAIESHQNNVELLHSVLEKFEDELKEMIQIKKQKKLTICK